MRGRAASSLRRIPPKCLRNTSRVIVPSSRSSGPPRQKCVLIPKVRCWRAFGRRMAKSFGGGEYPLVPVGSAEPEPDQLVGDLTDPWCELHDASSRERLGGE